ncbi:MAG: zinc ABC transporter ATP-binding protein AztA [Devosia sp.]
MTGAIRIDDLTLGYDGHPAVHHLSGTFAAGSLTAIVGPNGSGKSTLLKGVMGTLTPIGGAISRSGDIAYLPQSSEIDRSFPASVNELIGLGLWKRRGVFGGLDAADREKIAAALHVVGLDGFARRQIDTLSGGQMQRALFARVLLQDAPAVLLDEPFAAIDENTVHDLLHLVGHWHEEGRTVIAVLHDLELVRRHFPETLLLAREPIAWSKTPVALNPENLQRARRMPEAWDEDAPWHEGGAHRQAGHVH